MRFKHGDRVVIIKEGLNEVTIGQVYTVINHIPHYRDAFGEWYEVAEGRNFPDSFLVHEEVYNSPLYKALL